MRPLPYALRCGTAQAREIRLSGARAMNRKAAEAEEEAEASIIIAARRVSRRVWVREDPGKRMRKTEGNVPGRPAATQVSLKSRLRAKFLLVAEVFWF